jgi:phage head maturation protease
MAKRSKTSASEAAIAAAGKDPARLTIEAAASIELQAANGPDKRPTFDIVGYTGGTLNVAGFFYPVVVDLAGLKSNQQIPALLDHDTGAIVGQTDLVAVTAENVRLRGSITGDNPDAQEVVSQAKNGFKWRASIGASVDRREFLDSGKKTTVNGRDVSGPLVLARESTLLEISFVAIPADPATTADVAASAGSQSRGGPMNEFEKWCQARGIDAATLDEPTRAALQAAHAAELAAAAAGGGGSKILPLDELIAARRKEEKRRERIAEITGKAIDDRPALLEEFNRMAQAAITSNASPQDFELEVLRLRATVAPGVYIPRGDAHIANNVVEAALCIAGGLGNIDKHYDERTLNASHKQFAHGLSLRDFLLMGARENGYSGHSSADVRALLRAAFGRANIDIRAEGFSTFDIPGILSNVANKFLVAGFTAIEDTWRLIADTRAVRDFKLVSSFSLTGGMQYELVGPTGELKHASAGQVAYYNQARTYGRLFAITRQDIINDDLGALTRVPQKMGRGAALKLNDVFWTEFLNVRDTFWSTTNNNVITGTTSALNSTGLNNATTKFRKQVDPDGFPLGIMPKFLLVPPELETPASELLTSQLIVTGQTSAAVDVKMPNRNIWGGKYTIAVSTYLSNANYIGSSGTQWWLVADPQDLPTIEVAFLNGRDIPIVEQADADFDTLGIQMRGYHDFGCAKQEYRASVRAAGV